MLTTKTILNKYYKGNIQEKALRLKILRDYYKRVGEEIFKGYFYYLGKGMGYIGSVVVNRSFKVNKKTGKVQVPIDYKRTAEVRKEEPDHPAIYHTDATYYLFVWTKKKCRAKNTYYYGFYPTRGINGLVYRRSLFLKQYPYYKNNILNYYDYKDYIK